MPSSRTSSLHVGWGSCHSCTDGCAGNQPTGATSYREDNIERYLKGKHDPYRGIDPLVGSQHVADLLRRTDETIQQIRQPQQGSNPSNSDQTRQPQPQNQARQG